jgi:hypothetical protein
LFRKRNFVRQVGTLERFHVEESQSSYVLTDRAGGDFTLVKQVRWYSRIWFWVSCCGARWNGR